MCAAGCTKGVTTARLLRHALDGVEGRDARHGGHEVAVQPAQHAQIDHVESVLQLLQGQLISSYSENCISQCKA